MLGQVPELGDGFEALEHQFDLPAQAVPFQHFRRREGLRRVGCEHDHLACEAQRLGLDLLALALGYLVDLGVLDLDGFVRLAERADAACDGRPGLGHRTGRPVRDEGSTKYTDLIEDTEAFHQGIHDEAWRRGVHRGERVVALGDGAEWIRYVAFSDMLRTSCKPS